MSKENYEVFSNNIRKISNIDRFDEIELFLAISSLEYYILTYERIKAYNAGMGIDISGDKNLLECMIKKTQKFGVQLELDEDGKVIRSGDYMGWYEYHATHFNRTLSKEEFKKFIEMKSKGYNISKYLPSVPYLEYKNQKQEQKRTLMKIPV